jgi:phenylpropionate dioxygenase-like ring-hydroxylating dioxygenase large terminal subunit
MLSRENNELLCRVGPGTAMGALMREYWIPALPATEFPGPDSAPKRMRLLGENIVMYRDTKGRMGAIAEACPHRGASLYFGRNEECDIRCAYHGWKFDLDGNCIDAPTEPMERRARFQATIKARAYPCRDVNRMVWIYMGARPSPPPFPAFEVNTLPYDHVAEPAIMMEEANWLQNMEGDLDSAHLNFLHRRLKADSPKPEIGIRGFWSPDPDPPVLDVQPTGYGAYYTAKRRYRNNEDWHRINQFIFPFHTMITVGDGSVGLRSFVPLDDHYAMLITHGANPTRPLDENEIGARAFSFEALGGHVERSNDPRGYFLTKANKRNDYMRDQHIEKETMFSGIPFIGNLQDRAMTELMCGADGEPLYDRTQEHLGSSDAQVALVRRQLLEVVVAHRDQGRLPANVEDVTLDRVRFASHIFPAGADWRQLSAASRDADSGAPVGADVPLIIN